MKPLISYYGGKQRIASKIVSHILQIPHTVYAEPFAGGLSVLYAKGLPPFTSTDHYREAINDTSEDLINLYRVARRHPHELRHWLECTPYSQSEHRRAIAILKSSTGSNLERAWAYYVSINQSFAHKLNGGWGTNCFSRNSGATWHNRLLQLPDCLQRLSAVHIGCEDALQFIERWQSPQTLFYIDPPYPGTDCGHYGGYSLEDWRALCDLLDRSEASYILSNYPQPIEPQSAQQRIEIQATMSAAKSDRNRTQVMPRADTTRTEVLWICNRSAAIRPELQPVLDRFFDRGTAPAIPQVAPPRQQLSLF